MSVGLVAPLSAEQSLLLDASVRFMERAHPLRAVREGADGGPYDEESYRADAAKLGWLGLLGQDSEESGSVSGNGLVDAAIVAAERGARLQPAPLTGHSVVVHALASATHADHGAALKDLLRGDHWATLAHNAQLPCVITRNRVGWRVDGTVEVVSDAGSCERFLVTATGPDGLAQVVVATDFPGVMIRRLEGLDVSRRWFAVTFEGVRLDDSAFVEQPGARTEALVGCETQMAAVLIAAETVGAMDADLKGAVAYAQDRIAFGRPIGSFQAVKHLLANCSLWLEMSKAIVGAAAYAVGSRAPDGPQLAHAARSFVAEHSLEVAHGCFQVYGGIGFTWEHDQHLYFRRIAADAALFGSAPWHRRQLLVAAGV